jgi:hypothetical protein
VISITYEIPHCLPTSIIGASKIWYNISTVNLVLSGTIHDFQWIATIDSFSFRKLKAFMYDRTGGKEELFST